MLNDKKCDTHNSILQLLVLPDNVPTNVFGISLGSNATKCMALAKSLIWLPRCKMRTKIMLTYRIVIKDKYIYFFCIMLGTELELNDTVMKIINNKTHLDLERYNYGSL